MSLPDEINIDLGDGRIFPIERSKLEGPFYSRMENDHECTLATEYRLQGKVVHRSVHVTLKQGIGVEFALGQLG